MLLLATALPLGACAIVPQSGPRHDAPVVSTTTPAATVPPHKIPAATPIAPIAAPATDATAETAALRGVVAGPAIRSLEFPRHSAARAAIAFRLSCPAMLRRTDSSGLTQSGDWQAVCDAARALPAQPTDTQAKQLFDRHLTAVQVGDGKAFATGYFEPEIVGVRTRQPGFDVPVYRVPADLIEADLGQWSDALKGKRVRGRVANNQFVPYYDRAAIEQGALAGRGLELAWVADAAEFFFLQVQGSGRLRAPDGSIIRIGYAGQNGRDYVGIGKLLKDRGELGPGQTSMQGILAYLRADPVRGQAVMRENLSYVFFRELTGAGPLGAMNIAVTGNTSVAADPKFVPLGAPVWLSMDRAEPNGFWVAQDTGGAIRGANRFDTFWGAGDNARLIAGGMAARGTSFIMIPKASAARLIAAPQ